MSERMKIALWNPGENLLRNSKKLDEKIFDITEVFPNDIQKNNLSDFEIFLIEYENHSATRKILAEKFFVPPKKIFTFEEWRVRDIENIVTKKYRNLWRAIRKSGYNCFPGKNVLIIGGSGGIGAESAYAFHELGANVIVTGRNIQKLEKVCDNIGTEKINYLRWDITKIHENELKLKEAENIFGGQIDIVVNSAGILEEKEKSFLEVTEEGFDSVLNTNLKSMFFLCQCVIKYFLEKKIAGRLVNVLSNLGTLPTVKPYGISKWGGVGLTKGLGLNYAEYDIIVNGVAPGEVATDMSNWKPGNVPARRASKIGRCAFPTETANVIIQLAGFMGDNMPGEIVVCNGGDMVTGVRL